MYGIDDTQIMVYNMKRSPSKRGLEKHWKKNIRELVTEKRTLCSWLNYYDRVTQATPRTIFVSHFLNTSSESFIIVISFL